MTDDRQDIAAAQARAVQLLRDGFEPTQEELDQALSIAAMSLTDCSRPNASTPFFSIRARCELPGGEVVEVKGRNTPFFAICRELAKRGYGDCRIEISTPTGTPSIRAAVGVAAGLAISERDDRGLRMEKFRPFPVRGRPTDAHEGLQGSPAPGTVATRLASHRAGAKAA